MSTPVIAVRNFHKVFYLGLRRKPSIAAHDISFEVMPREIFGFLGPNGAGKTTTIKALLGLIRPDSGSLSVLGHAASSMGWRKMVGYLPEHPNFYEHLTGFELVTWFGRLTGLGGSAAGAEADRLLDRVGLGHAKHRRLRSYSKGMLQRAGLAQALVGSPKLLILDEPMTGLDPIGRKEIRELLRQLRDEGATIFYSTHILPDVEATCDRVAIVHQGRTQRVGPLREILGETTRSVSLRLEKVSDERVAALRARFPNMISGPGWVEVELPDSESARQLAAAELTHGALIEALTPNRDDLESIFLRTLGQRTEEAR